MKKKKKSIQIENIGSNSKQTSVNQYDSDHNEFSVPYHINYTRKLLNWAHMNLCDAAQAAEAPAAVTRQAKGET